MDKRKTYTGVLAVFKFIGTGGAPLNPNLAWLSAIAEVMELTVPSEPKLKKQLESCIQRVSKK